MKLNKAFETDIVEHPDDDGIRLVYADWLEEHGEEDRAEFIRAQIELARIGEYDDRSPALLRRQRELELRYAHSWGRPAFRFTRRAEFERGFVGRMTLTATKFLREADRLFAACPIRRLRLLQVRTETGVLAESPHLARLRALDLQSVRLGAARVGIVVRSEHLAGLEELNLRGTELRATGVRAVVNASHLTRLRELRLGHNHLGADTVRELVASQALPSLVSLDLSSHGLTDEAASLLARDRRAGQLESLDLSSNTLRDDAVNRLLAPGTLTRLRRLDLSSNRLGQPGFATVAASPQLAGLRELVLGRQDVRLVDLARSPHLAGLRVLGLEYTPHVPDQDAAALAETPFLPNLRVLRLPRLSPKGLRQVLRAPGLTGLHRLQVTTHSIGSTTSRTAP